MTQYQRWQIGFDEVMNFMEKEQRKLSKYSPKEKLMFHFIHHNKELYNAGTMKAERMEALEKLLALCEEYKRVYYLKDSFLIEEALRYDVKGRKYIGTETKYYFADIGIRAAILNYRQQEETHIMENIIYNELRSRGYNVDVGLVELGGKDENGKFVRKQLEVDFVVNRPPYRVYIQSAFHMPTPEKEQQERHPLLSINDHFRKIVIVGDDIHRKEDELGVLTVGLLDFLTDKKILEQG